MQPLADVRVADLSTVQCDCPVGSSLHLPSSDVLGPDVWWAPS